MARPRAARLQVGYDQGRRGEKPSQVVANDPDLLDAYDEGLSDYEDAQAPKKVPRQRIPRAPRFADATEAEADDTTTAAPAATTTATPADDQGTDGGGARMPNWLTGAPSITDGSGLLLGMFGYALAVNFLRGGTPQMKAWVTAKFLNKTVTPPPPATPVIPGGPGLLGGILGGIQGAFPGLGAGPSTRPRFGPQ